VNIPFTSVILTAKNHQPKITQTLEYLIDFLEKHNIAIQLTKETAEIYQQQTHPVISLDSLTLDQTSTLVIAIGGDGTLLHTARSVVQSSTPIIGINCGKLGFLTDIIPESLTAQLECVLSGKYIEEKRFFLKVSVDNQSPIYALNEMTLLPTQAPNLVEFSVHIDQKLVCHQRSDGLIIATPTGSTAYSLSGGGPILHPELNAMVLTPMFPHTLSMRPIVVSADNTVKVTLSAVDGQQARICCDGQTPLPISTNQTVFIKKASKPLRLIHPPGYDYYNALRSKLHWATKPSQG